MGSKIALKNLQDQEFSINHNDNAGALAIASNDIALKSTIETTIAPYNKGFKNYIINGNFDIWQYKDAGLTYPQTSNGYGSADRWYVTPVNSSLSRITGLSGYGAYAASLNATSASNTCLITQALESTNTRYLKGRTVTLSFNYSSSVTQPSNSLSFSIGKNSTPDSMLSGSWTIIGSTQTATPTTSVQKAQITLTIPNDGTAEGLRVAIQTTNITNGSSVYIYNIQLEEGSVATPFEQRPVGLELSLCQRYYEVGTVYQNGTSVATTQGLPSVAYIVSKRTSPTISFYSISYTNSNSLAINAVRPSSFIAQFVTTSSVSIVSYTYTASAEL